MTVFFAYNGEDMQFFPESGSEAREHAKNALEFERDDFRSDQWSDKSGDICWGIILESVERIIVGENIEDRQLKRELNVDVESKVHDDKGSVARALHRVVRAMHDGNCPNCGHLGTSESFYHPASFFPAYHRCPQCSFTIGEDEAKAAMQEFEQYRKASLEVFLQWREFRK